MASEGGDIHVDFSKGRALAQKILDQLEVDLEAARALGDDVEVARLEARKTGVEGPAPRTQSQIKADSEALAQENKLREEGLLTERETLDALKAQTEQRLEQAALLARQQGVAEPGQVILPVQRRVGTAGEQIAAEEAAAESARALALQKAASGPQVILPPERRVGLAADTLAEEERIKELYAEEARLLEEQGAAQGAGARAALDAEEQLQALRAKGDAARSAALAEQVSRAHQMEVALKAGDAGAVGALYGSQGRAIPQAEVSKFGVGSSAGAFTAEEQALFRLNGELRNYGELSVLASTDTQALNSNLVRLSLVQSEASNQMRKHGALTTEFLSALARGETTVSEFGYQIGATIQKFAGWTAAAAATYGALGAVVEIGKGAIDSSNGVGQLNRTINNLDTQKAAQAIRDLSSGTAVPIKDAADAMFQFSRTFHNVADASAAAKLGLGAFTLDNVKLTDSVRLATLVHQQYGVQANGLVGVFNLLSSAQREYNTRLSEMIPLVSGSIGAVRNAGGDLTQLIQLGTVLQRATGLGGSRVATGIYRAASNFAPANAADLTSRYGLPDPSKNFTQFLIDAVGKGSQLKTAQERTDLSTEIFGKQFGGRFAALFTPQSEATLAKVTGSGPGALTPKATQNAFQEELDKQLQTSRKQLDQFVYGLQRLGSALATSGILDVFGVLVKGANATLTELTHLVEGFGRLPPAIRTVIEALVAFKLASAFLTGSRFGASVGALPGLRVLTQTIPGLAPNPTKVRDQELTAGTRSALADVEDQISRQTVEMKQIAVEQNFLSKEADQVTAQLANENLSTQARADLLRERNGILAEIDALDEKNLELDRRLNAQQTVRADLKTQLVGLTTNQRSAQLSESDKQALASSMGVEEVATNAAAGEATLSQAAAEKVRAAKLRLAAALRRDAVATASLGAASAEAGVAAEADAVATGASTEAAAVGTSLMQAARNSTLAFATRMGDLAAAIDPLTIALIGIPIVMEAISSAAQSSSDAAKAAATAMKLPTSSLDDLGKKAAALKAAAKKQTDSNTTSSLPGFLGDAENAFINLGQQIIPGLQPNQNAQPTQTRGEQIQTYYKAYETLLAKAKADGKDLKNTEASRARYIAELGKLELAAAIFGSHEGGGPVEQHAFAALASAIAKDRSKVLDANASSSSLNEIKDLNAKQAAALIKSLDDYSQVFGDSGNNALVRAAAAFTQLAQENLGKSHLTSADIQQVATAQASFVSIANKNANDLLSAADQAQTAGGQTGDINAAIGSSRTAIAVLAAEFTRLLFQDGADAKKIAQTLALEHTMLTQVGSQLQTGIQAALGVIQAQGALNTSQITGTSPESGIARDQSSLASLQNQIAAARARGASSKTIQALQTQINDANNTLANDQQANANAISSAQGQLSVAAIQGTGPAADIARARQGVAVAQTALNRAKAQHAGQAAILQAQANLDTANNTLFSTMQTNDQTLAQDLQAFIQSEADLAIANTLSPVKAAQDQVAADIKEAATIQRKNYKSEKEYLTALNEANAKTAKDRQATRDAIVQQDLNTLAFESATQKIGDQQYINGLEQILKTKKLALAERQQIEEQIYNLQQGLGKSLDLNVGNLKLPSVYQIRRAIGLGTQGELPGAQNTVINHTATVNVYVNGHKGAHAVGAAIDRSLGTTVKAAMRARGV